MNVTHDIEIVGGGVALETRGLTQLGHSEIALPLTPETDRQGAAALVRVVVDHVRRGARLRVGDTMEYGYWLLRFEADARGSLVVHEHAADASRFIAGADLAIGYWTSQHAVCDANAAPFDPPRPDRMAVVSAGVMEGLPIDAVRYPSPPHMSGWWFTTERYDGDVKSLRTEHLYHVTARRPDLAPYVALPFGFRLQGLPPHIGVRYDAAVATEEP